MDYVEDKAMNEERITIIFKIVNKNITKDVEIPLDISANELVIALNEAYELGIDTNDVKQCYLKSERPIALIKGSKSLKEYGLRNGTVIYFMN